MLTVGGSLVCGALLAFAALILVFRRPAPPRWTTWYGVEEVVSLALVSLLTFGIGYLGAGGIDAYEQGIELIDLVLLVVVLVGTAVVWRRLDVRKRLRLLERPVGVGDDVRLIVPTSDRRSAEAAGDVPSQVSSTERAA